MSLTFCKNINGGFSNTGTSALICADIPSVEWVDCGIDSVDEHWCLNQGCCFEDTSNLNIPKCYYKAGSIHTKHIRSLSKE